MSKIKEDKVFADKTDHITDFRFGEQVVSVFDNMVTRSVPFYVEMQRMITEMAKDFAVEGTNIYDLGCSTGTTLINIDKVVPPTVKFVGIDESAEMRDKCKNNFKISGVNREYDIIYGDLNKGIQIENASVVILCLTLQFVRPLYREKLMRDIYDQMNPNSCLILVEKVLGEDSLYNRLFIKYYYEMKKRNSYSEMEIAQKREALENILIPYRLEENKELLLTCGFKNVDVFFKWYNFAGLIAQK
jgi:tRNA (cmo5U34)-methyltransferase